MFFIISVVFEIIFKYNFEPSNNKIVTFHEIIRKMQIIYSCQNEDGMFDRLLEAQLFQQLSFKVIGFPMGHKKRDFN